MSGSRDALLRHRPLRTVRASFPAYGSSLYKSVPEYRPATKKEKGAEWLPTRTSYNNPELLIAKIKAAIAYIILATSQVTVIFRSCFIWQKPINQIWAPRLKNLAFIYRLSQDG